MSLRSKKSLPSALTPALFLAALFAASCRSCDDPGSPVVQDFEGRAGLGKWPREAPGEVEISTEWKAGGERSLRIDPGLLASIERLQRTDLSGNDALSLHVHNTSERLALVGFEIADEHDTLYDRHKRTFGAPPGDSILEIDLGDDLWRGEENRPYRGPTKTPIDLRRVERLSFENRGDKPIFIDNIELVPRPLPAPPGAFAFDFGKRGSRVMSKTLGVFEDTSFTAERGFGFVSGRPSFLRSTMSYPSPLLGDGLAWEDAVFQVQLPGGPYTAWIAFERGGFWETSSEATAYQSAELVVNGAVAFRHEFSVVGPSTWFQDDEIVRVADAYEKVVLPAHAAHRLTFEAKPGPNTFSLRVTELRGRPLRVAGLVLAPSTAEGLAFLSAHEALQKRAFEVAYPEADHARRSPHPPPFEGSLAVEPRPVGEVCHPHDQPGSLGPMPVLHAVTGHRAYAQLTLYSKSPTLVSIEAKAPDGPGPRIQAIYQGRYAPKRPYTGGTAWIETQYLRPLTTKETVSVGPELSRCLVVELLIPPDAPAGVSEVQIALASDAGPLAPWAIPVQVHRVSLPPIPIAVGLFMSSLPHLPEPGGEDLWWAHQEALLERQGEAGLNTPTGGPGLEYTVSETAEAITISGELALRYLGLAKRYGLDRAVVGYPGFLPSIKHKRPDAKAFAKALSALESAHQLPPHYLYSYDEPATDEELAEVAAYLGPFHAEGVRTVGFFSNPDGKKYQPVLDSTFAPAVSGAPREKLAAWIAEGKHLFVYNQGTSRLSLGADLFSMIRMGIRGRLEWIGLYSQGFAFDDLDGREPSFGAFVAHGRLGPLPTPRWLSIREGLIDARILLALTARFGADAAREAGFPADYPEDAKKWDAAALEKARAEALRRLEEAAPSGP